MAVLKIMIVSTKGGVGKSTLAMQLVAPYLYEQNQRQKVQYYECDDTNKDIHSYGATKLINRHLVSIQSPMLREELFDICTQQQSVCIDVGGNNTAKTVLNALADTGGFSSIDLVLIPVLDGEQDMVNALDTYHNIKAIHPSIKIVFVLNKVKDPKYAQQQFDHFYGDKRGIFTNFLDASTVILPHELNQAILFHDREVIRFSRRFGLTVFEIAQIKQNYLDNLTHTQEAKIASFKHYMSKSCKIYMQEVLIPAFNMLNINLRGSK